jgi:hypothetical protein
LRRLIDDCNTIVVCLGHNNNLKGIYGQPRWLVHDTLERICHIIDQNASKERAVKIILMNTSGYSNSKNNETLIGKEKVLVSILKLLLPPFVDNIKAANYLRDIIGPHHPSIDWVVVRPDTLLDSNNISDYRLETKPTRSPFFDPGKVSRINVADFIHRLITEDAVWITWKNQMPVIYNLD